MRYAKLLPANKDERNNLIDILTVWKHKLAEYKENYPLKNSGLYTLWKDAINRMIRELKFDQISVDCFLLLNESDALQTIAICKEASTSQMFISDFLVAPWNIKNEIFTLNDILSADVNFNEELLIKFILHHYSSTNYSEIIYIPDFHYFAWNDVKTGLFNKLKFEPYYKYLSDAHVGLNGYKVSKRNLMEYRSSLLDNNGITFFSSFTTAKLLDNYPEMDNEAGDNIFKLHVK